MALLSPLHRTLPQTGVAVRLVVYRHNVITSVGYVPCLWAAGVP
jgi:hypothetical protein